MIKFNNVTKKFPLGNIALEKITFEIEDNEFLFIVGPSGAGKTTILKLILHDTLPSSGSILIDDVEISAKKFKKVDVLRRKIGMIFQDFKIIFDKNVEENIALSLNILGMEKGLVKKEVKHALELVGLAQKGKSFPIQLSAGELQRVAIARAIVGDRSIIIADEPTGNLDPQTTWEIMRIFKKLEGKKTIIIATHNIDVVNSMQKRVLIIKEGKLVKDERKGGYEI